MTRAKNPSRYPPEFEELFSRVSLGEVVSIPSGAPHSLKVKLWNFQKALRFDGRRELADSIQVRVERENVIVELRSNSVAGREVAAALAELPPIENGENSLFERLTGGNNDLPR